MKKSSNKIDTVTNAPTFEMILIEDITFSPFNYRKQIDAKELNAFAADIKNHGVISPVTVRKISEGSFELVAGERRVRAAKLAGLTQVPAIIQSLSDNEVIEMQLAENLQRENPHPLEEAAAIEAMQQLHSSINEIAARLGKSKQFVFGRVKLLSLINSFKELFLKNELTLSQALRVAALDSEGQQQVYEQCCEESGEKIEFNGEDFDYYVEQCKYDLTRAPFDTKDKKLIAEKGACTSCPFNTATLKTLFPELANEAKCTNSACYQQKCAASTRITISNAFYEHQPDALVFYDTPGERLQEILSVVPDAADLPVYRYYDLHTVDAPEEPDVDDYTNDDEELDSEEWEAARKEYAQEREIFEKDKSSGIYKKGLLVGRDAVHVVLFNPEIQRKHVSHEQSLTSKQVQEKIKDGTVTVGILQNEIERLKQREDRAIDLDREKVQLKIHETFSEQFGSDGFHHAFTQEDTNAAKLLIYHSMSYTAKARMDEYLEYDEDGDVPLFDLLKACDDKSFAYLIRLAVVDRAESKNPKQDMAVALYDLAVATSLNWQQIEEQQREIAEKRNERLQAKIAGLEKKIEKLQE